MLPFKYLKHALLLICATLVASCATTRSQEAKMDSTFNQKITRASVMWVARDFKTNIQRTAITYGSGYVAPPSKPTITFEDRDKSEAGLKVLVDLFSKRGIAEVTDSLSKANVQIVPLDLAPTRIVLIPMLGTTKLTDGLWTKARHELTVRVTVYDVASAKMVWFADFQAGAIFSEKNDESAVQNFATAVVNKLKGSFLL